MLEIGAGSGVITSALARRAAKVVALEPDHETYKKLSKNLKRQSLNNVEVLEEDFLNFDLERFPKGYKVFSNPPFHISSKIVHKLIESKNPPEAFYLILQKQFALKLLNTDRHYTSQLGKELIETYATKIRYPLKPTDFTPPPAVPTVLFEAISIPRSTSSQLETSSSSDQTRR